ncbi:MAG: phosphoenolpyruvate--protein phosphotransferase [Deltaproteobacteria bacterium]|jgi:phosphotransferase system enzyme I (PtsI)|nr:phosphoenolpyruvate--protein phosphotransferase [Deltaproteobacteria bacterium]
MNLPPPFVPQGAIFKGIGIGQGIAIGPAHLISATNIRVHRYKLTNNQMVEKELDRLQKALTRTEDQFVRAKNGLPEELSSQASIFDALIILLRDPTLIKSVNKKIVTDRVNAEAAVNLAIREICAILSNINDPHIRSRLTDIEQLGQALIVAMRDQANGGARPIFVDGCVVAAADLSPAEVSALPVGQVAGLITEQGSQTSHAALVAQALGLPTVMGATDILKVLEHGDTLIVDAREGHIIRNPDEDAIKFYQTSQRALKGYQLEIVRSAHLPAITLDDHRIDIFGNLELVEELPAIIANGGEGIGLYRTEFLYLTRPELPSEEELYEVYRRVVASAAPRPVTIRTLDLGADKILAVSDTEGARQNQALGLRAIRFCLKNLDVFRTQLRAIFRASAHGQTRVLLPMISSLEEIRQSKELIEQTRQELTQEGYRVAEEVPVGVMIEVPAAVILIDELAREADFLSIGTNDLIQYTLALDRGNPEVSDLYQPFHPSILRMIKKTIEAGQAVGVSVSVCGDMAAGPLSAPLLVGFGADMLSMPFGVIPFIKRLFRMSFFEETQKLAEETLRAKTADEALACVKDHLKVRNADYIQGFRLAS